MAKKITKIAEESEDTKKVKGTKEKPKTELQILEETIELYGGFDVKEKEAKKEKIPLGERAKELFSKLGLNSVEVGDLIGTYTAKDSVSIDSSIVIAKAKKLKLNKYIIVSESLNTDLLEQDLAAGDVPKELATEILAAQSTSTSYALSVKKKKPAKETKLKVKK